MSTFNKKQQHLGNNLNHKSSLTNTVNYLAELTRKDIERTYNIADTKETEIYYSNRYGWSLRRSFE